MFSLDTCRYYHVKLHVTEKGKKKKKESKLLEHFTHISWGSVELSVLEYKNSDPPLSMLRNFRDAKSVYSFVTANMSTQTPD